MRNPLTSLWHCGTVWRTLCRYPGLFSLSDAGMQLNRVILPGRLLNLRARIGLRQQVEIRRAGDGAFEVRLRNQGLRFFWPETPSNNLYFLVEQEIDPRNPHYYTSPPIRINPMSVILDVGACEGLFAFRALRQGLARRVICFEPVETMAGLIRRGAEANGVRESLTVETLAVDQSSGRIGWSLTTDVQANRADDASITSVESVSLDDYCSRQGIELTAADLIKIDAEGQDFRVLLGAERLIRERAPQIAVTTYHHDEHAVQMIEFLKKLQPAYRMRLKGFAPWTNPPRPVLLQAAM